VRIGRPRRFDQARPFVVLGIALLCWLVLPAALKRLGRASFFEMTAPVTVAASYASDLQGFWGLRLHSRDEMIEAGRDVARIASSYELAAQQNGALEAEVGRLKSLLQMPPTERFRLEHAEVAQRDFSSWWQRMVIRKGTDYGIPLGAPVVWSGGVVGRISEVHAFTAVVQLVTDPGLRIAAVVEGDTRPISYQGGDNQVFGAPRGVVEFLPLDIYAGGGTRKRLATSGLGGVFPPGLTIGQIIHVEASQDGLFKTGEVEIDPRISELTEVTVLVPQGPG
jgi:rod shape-determining protein MreC